MALRKDAIIDITREIVSSGVQERVQRGQNFEVWFYDGTFQADAVKMSWDPARAAQFGNDAAARVAAKRFDINANFAATFPSIRTLLKNSGELTVFILTDGFQPLAGTPFDEKINREMTANRDAFYTGKEPFLITLLGRNGEWTVGGVHSKIGSTIDIPDFPKPPTPPTIAKQEPNSDLPPSLQAIAKKEKPGDAPVQGVATTPPPRPAVEAPPPKRPEPDPVLEKMLAQIAAARAQPKAEPKIETKVETPKPAEPIPTVVAETKIVQTATAAPSTPPQSEIVNNQSSNINKETPIQAAITPQLQPRPAFWPILLAIIGLITAGGVFAYLKLKQQPPPMRASLISQAYNTSRDETLPRLPGSAGMRIKINLPPTDPSVQKERPKRQE